MADLNLVQKVAINGGEFDLSLTQGSTYFLSFTYPGDVTGGTFEGHIRAQYAETDVPLLASFSFLPTYDPTLENTDGTFGKTLVKCVVSCEDTALIPSTRYQGLGSPNIKTCHVYDIEYKENGVCFKVLRGLVQVRPEVTV